MNGGSDELGEDMYVCGYMSNDCTADSDEKMASVNGKVSVHGIIFWNAHVQAINSYQVVHGPCPNHPV